MAPRQVIDLLRAGVTCCSAREALTLLWSRPLGIGDERSAISQLRFWSRKPCTLPGWLEWNLINILYTGWWFGTFFIFPYIGNNNPNWLLFFRGVETSNQYIYINYYIYIHIHTYAHTHIHTYTHTRIHTYTHTHIHTYTHTDIHTYRQTDRQTDIHTYITLRSVTVR